MYPSKGSSGYGQQPSYPGQQSYGQMFGTGFSQGQSAMTGVSQEADLSAYRAHPSMMAAGQEADLSTYRAHLSQGAQYCATYAAVYGSSVLSTAHQVGGVGGKGAVPSGGQGRMSYPAALPDSSKFSSGVIGSNLGMSNDEYFSASSGGYAPKGDQFSAVKSSDYSSADRRHYGDQAAYLGRDLPSDSSRRYADSISLSQQHQTEDMDQASLLRQQQMLKAQALQSGSDMRQADYLAARAAQEFSSYGGRMDVDPRSLSILGSTPYGGQHAASILGGAPRRNADDLYAQGSSTAAYGVGLPPGRDYVTGKGLHGPSLQPDYQGNALSRGHLSLGLSMADERKDDRSSYRQELELRDDERRKDLLREREKEREREDRERQRDKDRERDRLLERREKERERDRERERERKRGRERTPPRATRDRRGSSLLKDDRTPRRASPRRVTPRRLSPRREAVHRRHSPVKEKKREYICKVHPFCLVDAEKDYLSLSKRYPRLSISPECSKVVLHWPKGSLNLSLNTPVSFEHDVVEVDDKGEKGSVPLGDLSALNHGTTVWNAKVLLMSGISLDALNDMCSYKSSDEKIVHFNNILRFAILKKDHSFMAVGGPWNSTIDGGDPSTEDSSLIQTAHRYVRDMTQLDLQNCQKWNRFLEIHYDRVGKDGLFSHKEITVLFVPDLSECIPSLDSWRSQWLAHKKIVAERERQLATKQEKKSTEKKEYVKEKVKAEEGKDTQACKSDGHGSDKVEETKDATKVSKKDVVEQKGKKPVQDEKPIEGAGAVKEETKIDGKKAMDGAQIDSSVDVQKPVKKKVVKKVMKRKVADKKATEVTTEDATAKHNDQMVFKEDRDRQMKQENLVKEEDASADPVSTKTFTRKKIVKKASTAPKVEFSVDSPAIQTEKEPVTGMENLDEKIVEKKEPDEAASSQVTVVKATGKKKIIRRVIKRKVSGTEVKDVNAVKKEATEESHNVALQKRSRGEEIKEKKDEELVGISKEKITEELKTVAAEKDSADGKKAKAEKESKKDDKSDDQNLKSGKGGSKEPESAKSKYSRKDSQDEKELTKDEKDNKSKDDKHESKPKSRKEVSDKGKSEEPPQHPGLFLQTKRSKESKVRSMSLSLDGLLHYNDKDIEESIFELSVFAESFNEMLQYQMGCCLLSFLEKLRKRFIISKKQNKRQRDYISEKEGEKDGLAKRPKVTDDSAVENESQKSGRKDTSIENQEEAMGEGGPLAGPDESKPGNKAVDGNDDTDDDVDEDEDIEEEEDPEEIIEEDPEEIIEDDQEMDDVTPTNHGVHKDGNAAKSAELKAEPEKATVQEDNGKKSTDEKSKDNATLLNDKSDREKEDDKLDTKTNSGKEVVVHKEVLQAFRYFDHNRVGYIKVEDLRCLLRNLGKFLSYRDVKELVQSALFESNSGRDKRIFYKKLVRLTDV